MFDASCTWFGCTNEAACNYDALATDDDGSCYVLANGSLIGSLEVQPGAMEGYVYEPVLGELAWTVESGTASSTTMGAFDITWSDPFNGGSITLTETDSTGCSNTATWTILNVNIEGIAGAVARVYPNPASDYLTIEQGGEAFRQAVVRDELGRMVAELLLVQGANRLDLGDLNPGMYFLTLQTGDGHQTSTQRFILQ
jgi:hypothetical protein